IFRARASEKELELILQVCEVYDLVLKGDPLRLQQVLVNLVGNSIKFTDEGEVELSARILEETAGQVRLEFRVRDTGPGIAQEKIPFLFRSFEQASELLARGETGTGLGLAISKQLVELMAGAIQVDSKPGRGSEFHFHITLPRVRPDHDPLLILPRELADLTALVVESNAKAGKSLINFLKKLGIAAHGVHTGAEALERLAASGVQPVRLLIVGWVGPQWDGGGSARLFLETLRHGSRGPEPKIIHLVPFGYGADRHALPLVDAVVPKPVTCSTLFESIMEIFGHAVRVHTADPAALDMAQVIARIGGARILLVEDNAINRQIATEIMQDAELLVSHAHNGAEAVEMLGRESVDLVLMDLQMPVMDGFTATRRIRADARHRDLPIIAMTAHVMESHRESALRSGMNDHLPKPIERQALFAMLMAWLPERDGPARVINRPTAEPPGDPLPPIPGIDQEDLLQRLGGKSGLIRSLLSRFAVDFAAAPDQIQGLLENPTQEHRDQARLLAHSIKGMAGNLSALTLKTAAAALEKALDAGATADWPERLQALRHSLDPLVDTIRALDREDRATGTSAPPMRPVQDSFDLATSLVELARLVDNQNFRAKKLFAALKPSLNRPDWQPMVEPLEQALGRFDFAGARDQLQQLAGRLGLPLQEEDAT
nr:response regulator [Magnetococcales bacterium]